MGFECYRIGDLLLDAGTQEVTRNGVVVPVPRLSFKLLLSLARHAPNVVSAEELEEEVWAGLVVDRGTVNKRVLLLRKVLSKGQGEDPYIAVIRGSGYRLIVPVERVDSSPGELNQETQSWYQRNTGAIRNISFWLLGIVAILALQLANRMISFDSDEPVTERDGVAVSQQEPNAYGQNFVAVLPFVDLSDGGVHQYIGDGIAEEVINLLAGMDGLVVAARTSSFAFRDTSITAAEIADKLRVGAVLEGSVRHSGERIRVTAQLIDTQSGYHIWSQNYDRSFDEVFAVQDDIAFNIAQSLMLTLDESDQPDSRKSMTADIEAFKFYLKGRELLNDRIHLRAQGLYDALDWFNKAIEQDPKFARAYAGVATVYWLLTSYDDSVDQGEYFEEAEASAKFALEINPDSTEALSALASINSQRGDIQQAAGFFNQIRAIGNTNSNIIAWEATLHTRLGYFEESISPLTEEYRRDPLNEHIAWSLADALIYSGKPAEAIPILEELEHFSHRDYYLGLAAIYTGNFMSARELLRDVSMRSGVLPAAWADLLIDALEDPALQEEVALKFIAATEKGDLNKLVSFESLLILGTAYTFELGINPLSDIANPQIHAQIWNNWAVPFRQDPRFKDWVSALGYVEFWRKFGWPDRCRPTGLDDFECI